MGVSDVCWQQYFLNFQVDPAERPGSGSQSGTPILRGFFREGSLLRKRVEMCALLRYRGRPKAGGHPHGGHKQDLGCALSGRVSAVPCVLCGPWIQEEHANREIDTGAFGQRRL